MSHVAGVTGRKKVAVIGAGLAGLACATQLADQGHLVRLFDKARGPGGRMSTRRFATPHGEAVADHGAQYFTARDPAFQAEVDQWAAHDIVTQWPAIAEDAWIGKPSMNAIIRHLAAPFDVQWNCRAEALMRQDGGWIISGLSDDDVFDVVILAIPSEQALTFLAQHDFDMARKAMLARFQPCWTVLWPLSSLSPQTRRSSGMLAQLAGQPAKQQSLGVTREHLVLTAGWFKQVPLGLLPILRRTQIGS